MKKDRDRLKKLILSQQTDHLFQLLNGPFKRHRYSRDLKPGRSKLGNTFEIRIFSRSDFKWFSWVGLQPQQQLYQSQPFENWTVQNLYIFAPISKAFVKMVANCPDFKWLDFWISDSIHNPNHLQTNLFLTIQNPDQSGFQIPTVDNKTIKER